MSLKTRTPRHNKTLLALACSCASSISLASPWLEANDPFLRSSLLLMSDAGQLSAPVNQYPLRWSMPGDDLDHPAAQDSRITREASEQLQYRLNSAKINRGNRAFKAVTGSEQSTPAGFGQFNEDQHGVYTSVEHLDNSFSYRLTAGYSEYQGDAELDFDDSYIAFNAGPWLWSIGNVDRWWGQGWQHNLILGSYAKAAPDVSVSYIGENPLLGVWSLESLIAKPSNGDYDYHSATRMVSKPFRFFEYGLTYQRWLSDQSSREDDEQMAIDAKLTLPSIGQLYHSIYGEAASTAELGEMGAWLVGWSGSFPVGPHTARLVWESQQATDERDTTPWHSGRYPSITDDVANTTYELDESDSVALYLQLHNDHQIGLIYQTSTIDESETSTRRVTYSFPALAGKVHLGAEFAEDEQEETDKNLWAGYEFRF